VRWPQVGSGELGCLRYDTCQWPATRMARADQMARANFESDGAGELDGAIKICTVTERIHDTNPETVLVAFMSRVGRLQVFWSRQWLGGGWELNLPKIRWRWEFGRVIALKWWFRSQCQWQFSMQSKTPGGHQHLESCKSVLAAAWSLALVPNGGKSLLFQIE